MMETASLLDASRAFLRARRTDALPPLLFDSLRRQAGVRRALLYWREQGAWRALAGFDGEGDWQAAAGDVAPAAPTAWRPDADAGVDLTQDGGDKRPSPWLHADRCAAALPLQPTPGDAALGWLWLQIDAPIDKALLVALAALAADFAAAFEQAESHRVQAGFLAGISHEIRTPMNAILGLSHLALRSGLTPQQHNYVRKVERSAESLLALMNDVFDHTQLQAGRLVLDAAPFDLGEVLDTLAQLLAPAADEKGLELVFNTAAELPVRLVGDAQRLGQVLRNLCAHAIDTTGRGEVTVVVEEQDAAADRVTLRFQVRDNAAAPPAEAAPAAADAADRPTGAALGLSIARRLVALMGGQIGLQRLPGQGGAWHFSLPFGLQPGARQAAAGALRSARVLVVDDNASARQALMRTTQSLGLQAEGARDGWDALRAVSLARQAGQPFDLVLLDWKMPGMDGVDCAGQLLAATDPPPPRIALMTAFGREDLLLRLESRHVPVDAVLTKPLTPAQLQAACATLLGQPTQRDPLRRQTLLDLHRRQLQGARLLVVDDNAINLELAQDLLLSAGVLVTVATDGRQALALLDEQPFDGVLMDVQMPVLDGLAATRAIRAQPRLRHLPVIAITANALRGDREQALAAGMNDHVAKPIVVERLFDTIARWVRPPLPSAPLPAPAAEAIDRLALLPGIDARVGRTSTMGNDVLYRRLLGMFLKSQRDVGPLFRAARAAGDAPGAMRMAHNLRTVAASLGALSVQASARTLEDACHRGAADDELAPLLTQVEHDLAPVMAGLATLDAQVAAAPLQAPVQPPQASPYV